MARRGPGGLGGLGGLVAIGLVVALAVGVWLLGGGAPGEPTSSTPSVSGLPSVDLADLPREADETVALIDAGGPFPYDADDETFGNFEGLLPAHERGFYREYTVPTPGSPDRGARRIIAGDDGVLYWTGDHYATFAVIRR